MVLNDYKVQRRDQYQIAQAARQMRAAFPEHVRGRMIDPVGILKALFRTKRMEKGQLRIRFMPHDEEAPAKITYNPLTLWVSKKVWRTALWGQRHFASWARARWVLFHEIGHIVLHDDREAMKFSPDASARTKLPKEESAEDQADKFAMFLACPMTDTIGSFDVDDVGTLHGLPEDISGEILEIAATYVRHKEDAIYTKQSCEVCGWTMTHNGSYLLCDNCVPPIKLLL